MTLEPDDIVWAFDGNDGRADGLRSMIELYVAQVVTLLPTESDDPFEQIVSDLSDDPTNRMLGNPRLVRLFPPALPDAKSADDFWRDSIHSQARARVAAARAVAQDLQGWEGHVPVALGRVDDWAKVLGALRLFWYTELAGPERLAEPDDAAVESGGLHDLIEWLGFLLDDLMESRTTCLRLGVSLDPMDFEVDDD
ncbi:DUF2017 family protein [Tessaracoccus sp. MC1679]|uniref:DUF2017 family protein n=1 Tax=Tessaracoccus sp. MC1679 TaxID=2760313 RepID=UPI0016006AA8|nr:DUF2017 family protein [Tessaracoccus sp. MC1679]MBB1515498.1 DUF2017 family protein [Tessaracoccus sp. MC1679]